MKFYRIGFFVLLILILSAGAYYLGIMSQDKPSDKSKIFTTKKVEKKVASESINLEENKDITPAVNKMSLEELKENIKAAINTGNTQPFETYMADKVSIILEASECCGIKNPTDATKQLDYLNDAVGPWNFDQSNDIIKKLKELEPTKYGPESAFIGIAANEYTVSFKFNSDNKINGITMAATYKLIIP